MIAVSAAYLALTILVACSEDMPTPTDAKPLFPKSTPHGTQSLQPSTSNIGKTAGSHIETTIVAIPADTALPPATLTLVPTSMSISTPPPLPTDAPAPQPTSPPMLEATATPLPQPTAIPERLEEKQCTNCQVDYEPHASLVDWVQEPKVSADGQLSFIATIDKRYQLTIPGLDGGAANVVFSVGSSLYGTVLPPSGPGWSWNPSVNQWIADTYEYRDRTLTVVAQVNPAVSTHPGLRLCLWTGGNAADVLDCTNLD